MTQSSEVRAMFVSILIMCVTCSLFMAAVKLLAVEKLPWLVVFIPIMLPVALIATFFIVLFFAVATSVRHRVSRWR